MKVTQVMVEFQKRVNDGNYGSESATAQYVAQVDEGEDPDEVIRQLVLRGRERVIGELKDSESLTVRRALNPPRRVCSECGEALADEDEYYHPACDEARRERYRKQQEEREAEWERQRLEREAQRSEHQLVAVGAADEDEVADPDEDDEDEPM